MSSQRGTFRLRRNSFFPAFQRYSEIVPTGHSQEQNVFRHPSCRWGEQRVRRDALVEAEDADAAGALAPERRSRHELRGIRVVMPWNDEWLRA